MPLATLSVGSLQINFLTFMPVDGSVIDQQRTEEEEHSTPGVNGRRWRTVYRQYVPFDAEVVIGASSFIDARGRAEGIRNLIGRLGKLTLVEGGTARAFSDVHIHAADIRPSPGPAVVAGDSTTYNAHLAGVIRLELTSGQTGGA